MRKIVAGLFMSLDGIVSQPQEWGYRYLDEEMTDGITAGLAEADTVLLGRRTYLNFARQWAPQGNSSPMAAFLNDSPKYVASTTLRELTWGPAQLISGDLADTLTSLKTQPGKNILIPGSPALVRALLAAGQLDELNLDICPVVVGSGERLFGTNRQTLQVLHSTTLRSGVLAVTYAPERR